MASPVICFGQQPCGFFPKRYLVAKIQTARRLQQEIGGEVVFFFHDSDHDARETRTTLRHRTTGDAMTFNFSFANDIQKKYSPLFLKRIAKGWREKIALQLPSYSGHPRWLEAFKAAEADDAAGFCLEMYRRMGLLEGIRVARSGDPAFRAAACDIADFFVDVPYEGETVRARYLDGELKLHKGGDVYVTLPHSTFSKERISPTRDSRLQWMQSVIRCTHYVTGSGEQNYLNKEDAPGIEYVQREFIERHDEAYTDLPP